MSRFPLFDTSKISLRPLDERGHDLVVNDLPKCLIAPEDGQEKIIPVSQAITKARDSGRPVICFLGAHLIKLGLGPYLVSLVKGGWITHLAMNGAGVIHDFELAVHGGTSESVARWIKAGQFGLWDETSALNQIVADAAEDGVGVGEGVGRFILEKQGATWESSVLAMALKCNVPCTSHVTIGADIIHSHGNCRGDAWGAASYTDFLVFAESIRHLDGGVFLNIGSAVTGPEIYLKALSMARNVAHQSGLQIRHFTTAVFDLMELPADWRFGTPDKSHPGYYFRPWKTILLRTVADGGDSHYVCGNHAETIPVLWSLLQ